METVHQCRVSPPTPSIGMRHIPGIWKQSPMILYLTGILLLFGCGMPGTYVEELSEAEPPKHEFRGAWLTSVVNLDWPASGRQPVQEQQEDAIAILDSLNAIGINAVLFQVRPESDALYVSSYDPWSFWLTGEQGKAPDPFYDPLAFFIREAHKRGMELHAWINPYRVERNQGLYEPAGSHIGRREPDWVLVFENDDPGNYTMLDPGLPEVRDYVTNVVVDIIRRYDVDGIHLDDYFYPYLPVSDEDSLTFVHHNRGFNDIDDWRRDNVNLLVSQISDSIKTIAPQVSFGISPSGIRKNSDAGTNGFESYYELYADGQAWLDDCLIDYISPQLYYTTDDEQASYSALLNYWSERAWNNRRHLYAGLSPYKLLPPYDWTLEQFAELLFLNNENDLVQGSIFFRTGHLLAGPEGLTGLLAHHLYRYPALTPVMPWKSMKVPPEVEQLSATWSEDRRVILSWTDRDPGPDEEKPVRFAVYRIESSDVPAFLVETGDQQAGQIAEFEPSARYLLDVTGQNFVVDYWPGDRTEAVYLVTAISYNSVESDPVMIRVHHDGNTFQYGPL